MLYEVITHEAFNNAYRNHYGEAAPFDGGELDLLREMRELDVRLGVLTNREREFFELELQLVDDGAWVGLFDTTICGGDTIKRKPNPEPVITSYSIHYTKLYEPRTREPGREIVRGVLCTRVRVTGQRVAATRTQKPA